MRGGIARLLPGSGAVRSRLLTSVLFPAPCLPALCRVQVKFDHIEGMDTVYVQVRRASWLPCPAQLLAGYGGTPTARF